jgi:uncharacterized protein YozE (UPF0346 family)
MIFQTLDDKSECVGIYTDHRLLFDLEEFPDTLTTTWKYAPYLRGLDIEYVSLYLEGGSIADNVPEYLQEDWEDVAKKIAAFKRSLVLSQVNTLENCFFDLVPQRFLLDFCEVKNKITEHILKSTPKPKRYEFYRHVSMMLEDMAQHPVRLNQRTIRSYEKDPKLRNQAAKLLSSEPRVAYKQFGTKTGRLTTQKNSFPILTLNRAFRGAVEPQNDYYIELDFNGAEVRTLLGLLEKEQPVEDVHNFHLREIFSTITSRDDAKVAFFAWLYGSRQAVSKEDVAKLASYYEKDSLLAKYWDGNTVTTPFGKRIPDATRHHALNYLVQSTAAELTLNQALKLEYLLRERSQGSHIAFLIHDAVVIDMKNEDSELINSLIALMSSTKLGKFMVNIKRGKTLGSMRDMQVG